MSQDNAAGYTGWAILEVFGHRKLGGYVQANPPELPGLVRIDVIAEADQPLATQYYGPSSIFCLTPCKEEVARRMAKATIVRPVAEYELPRLDSPARIPLKTADDDDEYEPEYDPTYDAPLAEDEP
jgi:hypothetical protein